MRLPATRMVPLLLLPWQSLGVSSPSPKVKENSSPGGNGFVACTGCIAVSPGPQAHSSSLLDMTCFQ